jgi:hypothetical protein
MAANEKAISQKLKSRSEIIRETSNRDPEDVWSEIEREEVELKKRGIVPLIPAGSAAPDSSALDFTEDALPVATIGKPKELSNEQAAATGNVQETALNGAQVQALNELVQEVAIGRLPMETAQAIAAAAFPLITKENLGKIFLPLKNFTAAPVAQPEPQP